MKVILAYKNFATQPGVSHIGLGVAGINNAKTLLAAGIACEVWAVQTAADLIKRLPTDPAVTHVIVSAPWIAIADWTKILTQFPSIWFAVNCHSNVGFLQADSNGVANMEGCLQLEKGYPNFRFSGNCRAFVRWIRDAYAAPCQYLPNLYYLNGMTRTNRPNFTVAPGTVLRIGCFGAVRPLKNAMSAGAAAIEIASRLRCNLEFHVSGGRTEGGGQTVMQAVKQMFLPIRFAKLVENNWEPWPVFLRTVADMHLLMQPSYTESFNMVTADGIAEGVPSVVSTAIEWVPDYWQADSDDVFEISRVGRNLLFDYQAPQDGLDCLTNYVSDGLRQWQAYLALKKV